MFSAYATLVLITTHYVCNYQDAKSPIDRGVIRSVTPKRWCNPATQSPRKWNEAVESAVLMFSDLQVLTGVAVLVCGLSQLRCGISTYHWQVMVNLAWFSSLTHLATLTSLRSHFRKRPTMAIWRVLLMGITLGLLLAALVPTGWLSDGLVTPIPAMCLFSRSSWLNACEIGLESTTESELGFIECGSNFNSAEIGLPMALVTSYITRAVRVFRSMSEFAQAWLRTMPGNLMKRCFTFVSERAEEAPSPSLKKFWNLIKAVTVLLYVLFKTGFEIIDSMLWEVCYFSVGLH